MLDAAAAVNAAGLPSQPRALIFTTPAIVLPNTSITVDGSTSVGAAGAAITSYEWSLPLEVAAGLTAAPVDVTLVVDAPDAAAPSAAARLVAVASLRFTE